MAEDDEHVLSYSTTPETNRVPEDGLMLRVSDTLITSDHDPDPEYHAEALATPSWTTKPARCPTTRSAASCS